MRIKTQFAGENHDGEVSQPEPPTRSVHEPPRCPRSSRALPAFGAVPKESKMRKFVLAAHGGLRHAGRLRGARFRPRLPAGFRDPPGAPRMPARASRRRQSPRISPRASRVRARASPRPESRLAHLQPLRLQSLRARQRRLLCRPLLSRRPLLWRDPAEPERPRLSRVGRSLLLPPQRRHHRPHRRRRGRSSDRHSIDNGRSSILARDRRRRGPRSAARSSAEASAAAKPHAARREGRGDRAPFACRYSRRPGRRSRPSPGR